MSLSIDWQAPVLTLSGDLDRNTVPLLWQQRHNYADLATVDVAALARVDTAGLAMLLTLCEQHDKAQVRGASERLRKLAELGNLNRIIPLAE